MTPLPKRRHSTRRGGKRQAAISYANVGLTVCPNCKAWRLPHRVCATCGFYDGKEVVKHENLKRSKTPKKN